VAERQSEIVSQRERVEQSGALKEKGHMAPHARQIFLAEMSDILRIDVNSAAVRLDEANHQLEGDALASATATQDAERFTCIDFERYVVKNFSVSKRPEYVFEFNRGRIAYKASLGMRKKMAFTKKPDTVPMMKPKTLVFSVGGMKLAHSTVMKARPI
jgi:hypothetical protein